MNAEFAQPATQGTETSRPERNPQQTATTGRIVVFQLEHAADFPIRDVSANFETLSGFSVREARGNPLAQLVEPEYRELLQENWQLETPLHGLRIPLMTADGESRLWLEFDASLELCHPRDAGNGLLHRHAIDCTTAHDQRETNPCERALDQSSRAVAIHDNLGQILWANRAYLEQTGFDAKHLIGRSAPIVSDDRRDFNRRREALAAVHDGNPWRGELKFVRGDGVVRWGAVTLDPIRGNDGQVERYMSMLEDITDLKEAQLKLEQAALSDPLTELPNRRAFLDRLQYAVESSQRVRRTAALFYLDLDYFKEVNDTLGHGAGDKVLETVAQRLRRRLRTSDLVSRIGGDEFTLLLSDIKNRETCARIAEDLLAEVARPIGTLRCDVTASIGIALIPEDSVEADRLLENADHALYRAKAAGRNRYRFFNDPARASAPSP